jgi:hypothetical protein
MNTKKRVSKQNFFTTLNISTLKIQNNYFSLSASSLQGLFAPLILFVHHFISFHFITLQSHSSNKVFLRRHFRSSFPEKHYNTNNLRIQHGFLAFSPFHVIGNTDEFSFIAGLVWSHIHITQYTFLFCFSFRNVPSD